jgi:hypothetical protein
MMDKCFLSVDDHKRNIFLDDANGPSDSYLL